MLQIQSDRTLNVLAWNKCNALCGHCGPSSGPKSQARISNSKLKSLMDEALKAYGPGWTFSISGGEPFLYYQDLFALIQHAYSRKAYTTLVTNAFWAKSQAAAMDKLIPLVQRGLTIMSISSDTDHDPFIDFGCVVHAIKAAQEIGLKATVRVVGSTSSSASHIMSRLRENDVFYVDVMEMPLVREGRACEFEEKEFIFSNDLPVKRCPSATLTINPNGTAMACCNGGGSNEALQLGNIQNHSLEELEYKFATDELLCFLRAKGPAAAINYLPKHQQEAFKNASFVNECDLCIHLFSKNYGASLKSSIKNDFMRTMQPEMNKIKNLIHGVEAEGH